MPQLQIALYVSRPATAADALLHESDCFELTRVAGEIGGSPAKHWRGFSGQVAHPDAARTRTAIATYFPIRPNTRIKPTREAGSA